MDHINSIDVGQHEPEIINACHLLWLMDNFEIEPLFISFLVTFHARLALVI